MEPSQLLLEFGKELIALTSAVVIPVAGILIAARVVRNRRQSSQPAPAKVDDLRR